MLMTNMIDLWASFDFEAPSIARRLNYKFEDLEIVFSLKKIKSYVALSSGTSKEEVQKWKMGFEEMKRDGAISKIAKKWAKELGLPLIGDKGIITFSDY